MWVSAINGSTYAVTVAYAAGVKEADVKGSLALTGPSTATANFQSFSDNKAVYVVAEADRPNLKNGKYTVTPSFDVATKDLSTTFDRIVSSTNVEGFVFESERNADGEFIKPDGTVGTEAQANRVGVADALVKVGGETVKTNSEGYYKLPVNAGKVKVEFTKDGNYFVNEEEAEVKRNYSTVQNTELVRVDVSKLEVLGKVVDTKTGQPVEDATVTLEKKVDGEWVELDETTTAVTTGAYDFGNTAAATAANKLQKDSITLNSELRVVVAKDLSAANLDDVYEVKTVDVTLSNKNHTTNVLTELRPIAEISEFNMDVVWNKDEAKKATLPTEDTTKLTFKLVDSNGKEILSGLKADIAGDQSYTGVAFDHAIVAGDLKENALKDAVDLVAKDFFGATATKPTLPTGKYFLVVSDDAGTNDNAIAVAPINITEGQNYAGKVEIEKARTLNLTANYSEIVYDASLTNRRDADDLKVINPANTGEKTTVVTPELVVTKKVDGVDVELERKDADEAFQYTAADKSIVSQSVVEKMGLGGYNISVENDYVYGGKATKATDIKTDVKNETISFETASTLEVELKTKAGTALSDVAIVGTTVELLDNAGKVVATTKVLKNSDGELITDNEDVATIATTSAGGKVTFNGIKPGDYKVRAKAVDHEQGTSKEVKVLDIQDQEIDVEMEAIKAPVVQGFVKFADDFTDVKKATVMAYRDGKPVTYYDLDANTVGTTGYEFSENTKALTEGVEYTFVVRGAGFENATATHKVTKGENEPLNFRVARGGEGKAKLSVTTSDKNALPAGATITATDSLFGGQNLWSLNAAGKWIEGNNVTAAAKDQAFAARKGPDYFGEFDFGSTLADAKEWNVKPIVIGQDIEEAFMSADDYKLSMNFTHATKAIKYASTITLGDINGMYYGEIEVPVDNKGVVEYKISGDVKGDNVVAGAEVVVAAFDKNGNLVTKKRLNTNSVAGTKTVAYDLTVPNGQVYSVAVYVDGTFVEAKDVTVQGFNEEANFSVEKAKR